MENENEKKEYVFGAGSGQGEAQTGQPDGGQSYGNQNYGSQSYGSPDDGQMYGGQSYGSPDGGQSYGNQDYGNQSYGNPDGGQMYGNQSYGNSSYGNQSFGNPNGYGMGSAPYGGNGQPLVNRYGMKLAFSILEILCCCGCNLFTMGLGIVSCVFNSKANRAYQEGRWNEFQSHAKTSAICLWIGFAVAVLYLIGGAASWFVGGGKETFEETYQILLHDPAYEAGDADGDHSPEADAEDDADWQEPDSDVPAQDTETERREEPQAPLDIVPGEGFTDPTITINDVTVTLPLSYTELKQLGISITEDDEKVTLDGASGYIYSYAYPYMYDAEGNRLGYVHIANMTEEDAPVSEGLVIGFDLTSTAFEDGALRFALPNGLTEQATEENFITAYGEPDPDDVYRSDDGDYVSYQWYCHDENYWDTGSNSIEVTFSGGSLSELEFMYRGWD